MDFLTTDGPATFNNGGDIDSEFFANIADRKVFGMTRQLLSQLEGDVRFLVKTKAQVDAATTGWLAERYRAVRELLLEQFTDRDQRVAAGDTLSGMPDLDADAGLHVVLLTISQATMFLQMERNWANFERGDRIEETKIILASQQAELELARLSTSLRVEEAKVAAAEREAESEIRRLNAPDRTSQYL